VKARTVLLGTGLVVLVGFGLALVWRAFLRDTSAPASVADAVLRYREEAAAGDTPIPPGVYVYRTTGSESISALGGVTHRYPSRSTITVTKVPCGMRLRWDVLTTRSTTWTVCAAGTGEQRLASWAERHVFFGQDDETAWSCSGSPWLTTRAAGTRMSQICEGGSSTLAGTVDVLGEETLAVGGAPVETIHVRLTATEHGDARGPLVEDRWVERETGLPVRFTYRVRTENDSPIGDVTFRERFGLRLASLEPRR
jgi:hypothetical protein